MSDTPRDADGAKLCAWCGSVIKQSGVGRSRDYCRRSCRQRAYEQRRIDEITKANVQLIRHQLTRELASPVSSRDETPGSEIPSRDETEGGRLSSRDEMKPAGPAPTVPPSMPSGPSRSKSRRLLPPPPGAKRSEAEGA